MQFNMRAVYVGTIVNDNQKQGHSREQGSGLISHFYYIITQKPFTKKEMLGWLNTSLKFTETMDELSTTCNLKSKLCQDAGQHLMPVST